MGILKCTIGGTDQSQYLKGLQVSGGGDGRPASATLTLDKQAAGLTITPRMVVNVWETFDSAGNGVGTRGRLFGGIVLARDTGNIGTTKTWVLSCADFNIIGTAGLVRDMEASAAVSLTAGTFLAQVTQLTQIIQQNGAGSVNTPISMTAVNNLYGSMPAVTWEGGHTYYWYLGQLCAKAVELSPALRPTFFLSTEITVGGSEVFGPPTLWVLDKAAPPSAAFIFTDVVPAPGGEYNMYDFKRKSATNELVQRQQIQTPTQVLTGFNSAAALSYPNLYINHGVAGGKGAWMAEPLAVQVADNTAAQALIDRKVESAGYPRDSYTLLTDQRPRIGEWVEVTHALEGMSSVLLQVVETEYEIEPPLEIWCRATLNARRLKLGESAEDDIYAPPPLGDRAPPLPPASITKTAEVWDEARGLVRTVLVVGASPSADTVSYTATITEDGGEARTEVIANISEWVIYVHAQAACIVRVWAIDSSGNRSVDYTELTWTAISATAVGLQNPGFDFVSHIDTTLPIHWSRAVTGGGTADRTTSAYVGTGAARLLTTTTNPSTASLESDPFVPVGTRTQDLTLACMATASAVGVPLGWTVTFLDSAGATIGVPQTGTFTLTMSWARYPANVPAPVGTAYASAKVKFQLATTGTSREVWIDAVAFGNQATGDDIQSGAITDDKLGTLTDPLNFEWDIETNPLRLYDASGNYRGTYEYQAASDYFRLTSANPSSSSRLWIQSSGELWLDGTGGNLMKKSTTFEAPADFGTQIVTGSRLVTAGTSFPGSPATGQAYFRTDLGVECYYDGTRWLGPEITIPFTLFEATAGGKTGTSDVLFARLPQDRALYLTNLSYLYLIQSGAHTLGNYWNIVLYRNTNADAYGAVDTSATNKSTVGSFVETADVSSWTINPLAADDRFLKVRVEIVGSPGPILVMPTLKARPIYT